MQKTSSDQPTHCWQCKKRIPKSTVYFAQSLGTELYRGAVWQDWCLKCGEKQNEESEKVYQRYEEELRKGRGAFLQPIIFATGGYILTLGIWGSFWGAFFGSLSIMLIMFSLNKEKILKSSNIDFATVLCMGIFCLYIATTFSIPAFCWAQDFLNIGWLSRTICSGNVIMPSYMEVY
jgi:hypothetical protein